MVLLSKEQLLEIVAWYRMPGPTLKDYDKPILYKIVSHMFAMIFSATIMQVDNVFLGITMTLVFIGAFIHAGAFMILSMKRANENFKERKELEKQ